MQKWISWEARRLADLRRRWLVSSPGSLASYEAAAMDPWFHQADAIGWPATANRQHPPEVQPHPEETGPEEPEAAQPEPSQPEPAQG